MQAYCVDLLTESGDLVAAGIPAEPEAIDGDSHRQLDSGRSVPCEANWLTDGEDALDDARENAGLPRSTPLYASR